MTDELLRRLDTGEACYDDKCLTMDARSGCICAEAAAKIRRLQTEVARPTPALTWYGEPARLCRADINNDFIHYALIDDGGIPFAALTKLTKETP